MAQPFGWIHSFAVTETNTHKKGYTIYKINSIVFPRTIPEALTCISVWKRFHDVKRLYRDLQKRHKNLSLSGKIPEPKSDFFKRFDPEVIQARREYIINLLDFAAQHPALYKSQPFLSFFENGYSPNNSPLHKISANKKVHNIEKICDKIDVTYEDNISLIHPLKDNMGIDNVHLKNEETEWKNDERIFKEVDEAMECMDENAYCSLNNKKPTEISKTPILTPMVSIEEGDTDYIYEAALEFSQAVQAEVNLEYQEAHQKYKNGIEILLNGSKDEINEERKFIAKAKVAKYMARADEIYEKFILHRENEKKLSFQLSIDMSEDSSIQTAYLERPWNQLTRFKVLQIFDTVLQVQDVTDKSVYVLKGIEKPTSNSKTQSIFLPQSVPYMVELVGYFQSIDKIFLLLRQAKGGKLFEYIKMYTPNVTSKISLNDIFTEVNYNIDEDLQSTNHIFTNINDIKAELDVSILSSDFDKLFHDYKEITVIENNSLTHIRSILKEDNSEVKKCEEIKKINSIDLEIQNICENSVPSQDMEVSDLVNCSQMLLNSVARTLDKSKHKNIDVYAVNEFVEKMEFNKDKDTVLDTKDCLCIQQEQLGNIPCSPRMKMKTMFCVPEVSVKQWARELLVAIDSLHAKGVILGDLHSDNILLGSKGQLLLSYFYQNEEYNPGTNFTFNPLVNESFCVAPERPLTVKSDWWSFGVILFELITGCSFKSCHPGGIYMYYEVQFPSVDISEDARNLLENLLVIEPEGRFDVNLIKSHNFFEGTLWNELYQKGINYM